MTVNIEAELKAQLQAVNDKLAALEPLKQEKNRLEATLKLLTGEISLDDVLAPKAATKGKRPPMSEAHKLKIRISHVLDASVKAKLQKQLAELEKKEKAAKA
jgi:hypothetical protein